MRVCRLPFAVNAGLNLSTSVSFRVRTKGLSGMTFVSTQKLSGVVGCGF